MVKAPTAPSFVGSGVSHGTSGNGVTPLMTDSASPSVECPFEIEVSFALRNIGRRSGAEVAQLYIAPTERVVPPPCPVQWLAGFAKIDLKPDDERQVALRLDETAFRRWDAMSHRWFVYPGEYEVRVASSSRDVRLVTRVKIGEGRFISNWAFEPASGIPEIYRHPTRGCFAQPESARAFAELYARSLPERPPVTPFTIDSTVSDMGACWLGRRLYRIIDWVMAEPASKMNRDQKAMMQEMAADMPLRSLTTSGVPLESVKGLVSMLNGHYLTGFRHVFKGLMHFVRSGR